ncbi:MAG: class I adenylate-forming enzyme family protein [Leptospira sp.]|nr:class I adenylate-forming enzyme family protein [Leptospira sp.]
MAKLVFAENEYFLRGHWDEDLELGEEPILIDPKWKNTNLVSEIESAPNYLFGETKGKFWIATSGSTGLPKLIQKDKYQLLAEVQLWLEKSESLLGWTLSKEDRFIVSVPLCHLYGLIWGHILPKAIDVSVSYVLPKDLTNVSFQNNDLLITIPYFIKQCRTKNIPLPKRLITSGSKFPVDLAQDIRKEGLSEVREIYGSTETGAMGYRDPLWKARYTFLPNVIPRIMYKDGEEVLKVQSEFVSSQALVANPGSDETKKWELKSILDFDGYFDTNDCGNFSDLGWNYFGRVDRITKIKGKRISLDQIETFLQINNPTVDDLAVVSYPKDGDYEIGCMIISDSPIENLKSLWEKEIPNSHIPKKIVFVSSIPKLPNGKTNYLSVLRDLI